MCVAGPSGVPLLSCLESLITVSSSASTVQQPIHKVGALSTVLTVRGLLYTENMSDTIKVYSVAHWQTQRSEQVKSHSRLL